MTEHITPERLAELIETFQEYAAQPATGLRETMDVLSALQELAQKREDERS